MQLGLSSLVLWGLEGEDPAACAAPAKALLRGGADVNFVQKNQSPLFSLCDRPRPHVLVLGAILEMPDVRLDVPSSGPEDVAETRGQAVTARLIRATRAQQGRWGGLRRAWVFAVVRPAP